MADLRLWLEALGHPPIMAEVGAKGHHDLEILSHLSGEEQSLVNIAVQAEYKCGWLQIFLSLCWSARLTRAKTPSWSKLFEIRCHLKHQ